MLKFFTYVLFVFHFLVVTKGQAVIESKQMTEEQINELLDKIQKKQKVDLNYLHQALKSSNFVLRALAAKEIGELGNHTSISHLIDALNDESEHLGASYSDAGMNTTRYWANLSLKKLTQNDFGFKWDGSLKDRQKAIKKWQVWYLKAKK